MTAVSISRLALVATLALAPAGAMGQGQQASPYEPCSRIVDNAARLQCFDATYARETTLAVQREVERKEEVVENFGFSEAQVEERAREERQAQVAAGATPPATAIGVAEDGESLTGTVKEVFTDQRNNYVVMLDNGQIWRSTAAKNYRGSIRPGWKVQIKEGKFAGYRMTFEGKTGFLGVERIR